MHEIALFSEAYSGRWNTWRMLWLSSTVPTAQGAPDIDPGS